MSESDLEKYKQLVAEKTAYYKAMLSCMNCGQGYEAQIARGATVRSANPLCPNCGCGHTDVAREWERR